MPVTSSSKGIGTMTRKSHRKSRRGCLSCKQRRIKCDEQKPACNTCIIREVACTYPTVPLVWIATNGSSTNGEAEQKSSIEPSSPTDPNAQNGRLPATDNSTLNLKNIDLIIHWFTKTVHTVNSTSNLAALEICQTVILKQAMQHHFLLHGLLALSALHLADSQPDPEQYTTIATTHHTQGLILYHSILPHMNESNYSASIAFSSVTIMFVFALSRPQESSGIELVDSIAQVFILTKGWHKVVHVADRLECRDGSAIFPVRSPGAGVLLQETEAAFGRLNALNQGHDTDIYKLAIQSLKSVFETLEDKGNETPHTALEWVNTLPEDFVRLMGERRELALVILGYYCVVLNSVPQEWWLRGWSKGLFDAIWCSVDRIHQDVLEWPRKMIAIGPDSNLSNIELDNHYQN